MPNTNFINGLIAILTNKTTNDMDMDLHDLVLWEKYGFIYKYMTLSLNRCYVIGKALYKSTIKSRSLK